MPIRSILRRASYKLFPQLAVRYKVRRHIDQVIPEGLAGKVWSAEVAREWFGHAGIDLREEEQLARLEGWDRPDYRSLFRSLREDPRINTRCLGSDYLDNGWYMTPDAEIYAAMICDLRPPTIAEIGGGYSTLIAREAVTRMGVDCEITVVDPEPRTDVREAADHVVLSPVQQVEASELLVRSGSFLFVDSSHIARAGGDIPHIYNRLLPSAPAGTVVHVHDIYLPFEYPHNVQARLYTEQYVLQALLSHSSRYRVLFATRLMAERFPERLRAVVGSLPRPRGGSFWFEVVADP